MGRGRNGAGRGRGGRPGVRAGRSPVVAAPATVPLLGPTRITSTANEREYSFDTASGNAVAMYAYGTRNATVDFTVNDTYDRLEIPTAERNAISMRLLQLMRDDARTRPDGFQYGVSANGGDGFGMQRTVAYQAVGFSRPYQAEMGESQYSVVRGGKLRPDTERLRQRENALTELDGVDRMARYDAAWATQRRAFVGGRRTQR